jgi:thiamine biosynthesis protein ThiI
MYSIVVVRYGEVFLKSEFVKRKFEDRLVENIRLRLRRDGLEGKIVRRRHRIYVKTRDAEMVADSLRKVFGIVSVSPAIETTAGMGDICKAGLELARARIREGESFAVRVKRTGEHEFSSKDVEKELGGWILDSMKVSVDLNDPDKTIFVEIPGKDAFVFDRRIKCWGGLPYGTQGKAVSLISTGIDSPVASWMMMRRGCEIVALHLGGGDGIENILRVLGEFSGCEIKSYVVPYDGILGEVSKVAGKYACVICKRTMLRIAKRVMEIERASGIVTGDSLGQVASQTLRNMEVISEAAFPIYRPLIGMDKNEIVKIAREIGTYDLSGEMHCDVVPRKPATKSRLDEIKSLEEKIGVEGIVEDMDLECLRR